MKAGLPLHQSCPGLGSVFLSFEVPVTMTNDKVSADKAMTGIMTHSSVWEFKKSQMVDSFQQLVG